MNRHRRSLGCGEIRFCALSYGPRRCSQLTTRKGKRLFRDVQYTLADCRVTELPVFLILIEGRVEKINKLSSPCSTTRASTITKRKVGGEGRRRVWDSQNNLLTFREGPLDSYVRLKLSQTAEFYFENIINLEVHQWGRTKLKLDSLKRFPEKLRG